MFSNGILATGRRICTVELLVKRYSILQHIKIIHALIKVANLNCLVQGGELYPASTSVVFPGTVNHHFWKEKYLKIFLIFNIVHFYKVMSYFNLL